MTEPADAPQHPRLTELRALTDQQRLDLIETLIGKGFGPGCWIRAPDSELVDAAHARRFITDAAGSIDRLGPSEGDPAPEPDIDHAWDPPDDDQDAWIIISQTCDLVRDIRDEPLVQLALLRHAAPADDLTSWSRNSGRWIPLDPKGKRSRHYADLRVQAFIAKHVLAQHDVRQAVPPDADTKTRPRTRFALRTGQRFSRSGIPTWMVTQIVDPLAQHLRTNKQRRDAADGAFSEWLLEPSDSPSLIAVTTLEDFANAEDLLHQLLEELPDELRSRLDLDKSRVIALDDLTVPLWLSSYKLDLDFLTYGAKGDSTSPEPHT